MYSWNYSNLLHIAEPINKNSYISNSTSNIWTGYSNLLHIAQPINKNSYISNSTSNIWTGYSNLLHIVQPIIDSIEILLFAASFSSENKPNSSTG